MLKLRLCFQDFISDHLTVFILFFRMVISYRKSSVKWRWGQRVRFEAPLLRSLQRMFKYQNLSFWKVLGSARSSTFWWLCSVLLTSTMESLFYSIYHWKCSEMGGRQQCFHFLKWYWTSKRVSISHRNPRKFIRKWNKRCYSFLQFTLKWWFLFKWPLCWGTD